MRRMTDVRPGGIRARALIDLITPTREEGEGEIIKRRSARPVHEADDYPMTGILWKQAEPHENKRNTLPR